MQRSMHTITYRRFLRECARIAFQGGPLFYAWMILLTGVGLVGFNAWAHQLVNGMILTNMTDHVSWGLYIANFTFMVGLAAGAVMMVIPAYVFRDHAMHDVAIFGELLAIAAIVMCLAFVNVDLGHIERFWHLIPGIGKFNWPMSMLSWDVIVLAGYLALNAHVCGYLIYMRFLGRTPDKRWYLPFVLISIAWAVSIHTVTAFLYSGLGGRPFWNSAILAPRFITSAFVTGPAFIIVTLAIVARVTRFDMPSGPTATLTRILRITAVLNLFMLGAELFTEFYTGGHHASAATYLYFGLHGQNALVPWIWSAIALNVTGVVLLYASIDSRQSERLVLIACVLVFCGVWIEKGMGLIIPGFVPSTLHEIVEYTPSLTEWKVTLGIWALGLGIYTVLVKIAVQMWGGASGLATTAPVGDVPAPTPGAASEVHR